MWKQFVQNHVNGIRKLVSWECWSHCQGQDNPADIPFRGTTVRELVCSGLWWNGSERTDPSGNNVIEGLAMPEECATEMKVKNLVTHNLLNPSSSTSIDQQQVIV